MSDLVKKKYKHQKKWKPEKNEISNKIKKIIKKPKKMKPQNFRNQSMSVSGNISFRQCHNLGNVRVR